MIGATVRGWWQEYVAGRLRSPQSIARAARAETPDAARSSDRFFTDPEPSEFFDAPARLRAESWVSPAPSSALLGLWERADWQQCDRRLVFWAAAFQEAARKRGIPLYVAFAFRGEALQNDLVARGVSKTPWPRSAHNIGEAVDVVHAVFHWNLTSDEWAYLHKLGCEVLRRMNGKLPKARQLALNWGGDDGTGADRFRWDPAHWEIADYRTRTRKLSALDPLRLTPRHVLRNLGL